MTVRHRIYRIGQAVEVWSDEEENFVEAICRTPLPLTAGIRGFEGWIVEIADTGERVRTNGLYMRKPVR